VTAGAAKTVEFPVDLPELGGTSSGGATTPIGDVTGSPGTSGGSSAPTGLAPSTGGGPVGLTQVRTTFEGVPLWLVILLVILAFASSRPLTAAADRLLSARAGAGGCPDEGN
jgi:hypothetical protein